MGCTRPNTPRSDPYDLGELEKNLRDRLYTAAVDAPAAGLVLVSGYRDPGRQYDLRTPDRGIPAGEQCNPAYKGNPPTAVPAHQDANGNWVGGSHHQHRTAADMGGRDLSWLIANREKYGLGLTVRSENWHYETTGRDARTGKWITGPTVRILEYPGPSWDDPVEDRYFVNDSDVVRFKQLLDEKLNPVINEQKAQSRAIAEIRRETVESIPEKGTPGAPGYQKATGRFWIGKIAERTADLVKRK